jgi:hypothetical protein
MRRAPESSVPLAFAAWPGSQSEARPLAQLGQTPQTGRKDITT